MREVVPVTMSLFHSHSHGHSHDHSHSTKGEGEAECLARSMTRVFVEEPTVEAITLNRPLKTISVATLGQVDAGRIQERVSATVQAAQGDGNVSCGLLTGHGDCHTCDTPLTDKERRAITIKNEGESTTIARVTCPTAPSFWRWRDFPWPRVVQRDVEFMEHADHADEWKMQLAAAIACGVFGLAGYFLRDTSVGIYGY